ncbi:MAG: alanine racemase [Acidobacteria bacterium]|nr:alanine racemase [Acidobacteriota bacterium]
MHQFHQQRPTWAEVSLAAVRHNFLTIKKHLNPDARLMAVVKADAYGHGAVECSRVLESIGADWFGVAMIEEGAVLREAGITRPIFCLGGFWQGQAEDLIKYDLTTAIFRLDSAEELNARAREAGRMIEFHLKVDTGMGRLGIPVADVAEFAHSLKRFDRIKLDGVMTHFAEADSDETDYSETQIERFKEAVKILRELGFNPAWQHLANSAGIHAHPQSHGNLARAGATLYGLERDVLASRPEPFGLRPVLSLHSRVSMLKTVPAGTPVGYGCTFRTTRESRIATIPIGYADGFRRAHSNNGRVIVRGRFAPIVGRVSMDLTMIDVTDVPDVELADEVILIGEEKGLRIAAEDLAEEIGTISYEIVTGISSRVPRVFSLDDDPAIML